MCPNCFLTEIDNFPTEKDWLKFDLELTKKLSSKKMKHKNFKSDGISNKDDGEYFYECLNCLKIWKLKEPDYAFRGYFKEII